MLRWRSLRILVPRVCVIVILIVFALVLVLGDEGNMLIIPVAIAGYFINYAVETWPGTDSAKGAKLLAGAQGAFAMGRFLGSGIMKYTKARYVFGIYLSCCVAFLAASVTQRNQIGIGTSRNKSQPSHT